MTYRQRLSMFFLIDTCMVGLAVFMSWFLVNGTLEVMMPATIMIFFSILISHYLFSIHFHLYKKAWEYASIGELIVIVKVVFSSLVSASAVQLILLEEMHVRLWAAMGILLILLIGGSRFFWRIGQNSFVGKATAQSRTLIVGAGSAGMMVVRQLLKNPHSELLPVGFIDDDGNKQNLDILGIPVVGRVNQIGAMVEKLHIDRIIIAIPSLGKKELNHIFNECMESSAKTQMIPMLEDLLTGKVSVSQFRDVQAEDVLGREMIKLDIDSVSDYITGKTVLVTGAGGSIGSEICRQVIAFHPARLILLGHGEYSIYSIEMELRERFENVTEIITEIADIQDIYKLNYVMNSYRPDVVYHAAAHKHVPLMERNPEEAVENNLIGTMNAAKAASWNGVGIFVMISTDKAVNPTSVMGATKRLAEMAVQDMNRQSDTKFVAVRFGNVLGSRGSVIPLFKKQIERGGPVTVTHPDMVRYFMTIPEASRLVIQAGALANGGEIFVLDMGEPVRIVDLACNLIKMSGHSIEEIGIEFTGIRPGEKLYEELLQEEELHENQIYPKIYIGKTTEAPIEEIEILLREFSTMEREELRERLLQIANGKIRQDVFLPVSI